MDYGCDTSNRFTGYLDSSDHGTSASLSVNKNKRKAKKKRKPKNRNNNLVDKCINTEEPKQFTDTEQQQQQQSEVEPNVNTVENQQSFSAEGSKSDLNEQNESEPNESEQNTTECPKSSLSCDSLMQSDTTHDDVISTNEKNGTTEDMNMQEMKWSVICFEEEKTLAMESQSADVGTQKAINEPELIFNEHRVYPTLYFYNSNFGNKARRAVNWHDSGRRSRNDSDVNRGGDMNRINRAGDVNRTNDEKRPNQKKRFQRRKKNYQKSETDEINNEQRNHDESRSTDAQHTDDREHQKTNEYNDEPTNRREYINNKNRYNKFKHGMPERTFTRRRRPDFVRNVWTLQ